MLVAVGCSGEEADDDDVGGAPVEGDGGWAAWWSVAGGLHTAWGHAGVDAAVMEWRRA